MGLKLCLLLSEKEMNECVGELSQWFYTVRVELLLKGRVRREYPFSTAVFCKGPLSGFASMDKKF